MWLFCPFKLGSVANARNRKKRKSEREKTSSTNLSKKRKIDERKENGRTRSVNRKEGKMIKMS